MPIYKKIEILGLRGFSEKQSLSLGVPTGQEGSGLTVIVGPNNSGKSTIYEAFRAISQDAPPSFTEGKRNKTANESIEITIYTIEENKLAKLKTINAGGSETEFLHDGLENKEVKFFTLPSRRTFSPFFGKAINDRNQYISNSNLPATRGSELNSFFQRLFKIQSNQTQFNNVIKKVLGNIPNWNIDQADNGNYYLKFNFNGSYHNSDGVGEGLLSVFTIVDALYDSSEGDLIFIDEPELSLHPSLQRKLINLLLEYSKNRQIILSTHSPYFISWQSIKNGGKIARTVKEQSGIKIYQLQDVTTTGILSLVDNLYNPHILGLDAREIFFLDDKIILVEGQEDVVYFNRILEILQRNLDGVFFGWGVGGAGNISKIGQMLNDLGFKKVATVLDNNKDDEIPKLQLKFPDYKFWSIPTDDIRDKEEVKPREAIKGIIDRRGTTIYPEYKENLETIFAEIDNFFSLN